MENNKSVVQVITNGSYIDFTNQSQCMMYRDETDDWKQMTREEVLRQCKAFDPTGQVLSSFATLYIGNTSLQEFIVHWDERFSKEYRLFLVKMDTFVMDNNAYDQRLNLEYIPVLVKSTVVSDRSRNIVELSKDISTLYGIKARYLFPIS